MLNNSDQRKNDLAIGSYSISQKSVAFEEEEESGGDFVLSHL